MKNWFKKLSVPSGETKELIAYNSWIVRWKSVRFDGEWKPDTMRQCEIFPSESDANSFAKALGEARDLLKDRRYEITVETNQSKIANMLSE